MKKMNNSIQGLFIGFVLISSSIVPIFIPEFFPYSSFALFTDAPKIYVDYHAFDENKKSIDLTTLGLQRNYYGISPRTLYGRLKPPSIDRFGAILNCHELQDWLMTYPEWIYEEVQLQQVIFGSKDGKIKELDKILYRFRKNHDACL